VTNLGQTRQINQSQVEDMRRVDFEVDGLPVDALVGSRDPRGFILDLSLHVGEVVEPPVWNVMELGPLRAPRYVGGSVGVVDGLWSILIVGDVDELKNQRPAGDDAASSRQEVSADNVFQDRGFTRRLGANNDLGGA
jgi:hypothetical protein